jgi:hypothetical protein
MQPTLARRQCGMRRGSLVDLCMRDMNKSTSLVANRDLSAATGAAPVQSAG